MVIFPTFHNGRHQFCISIETQKTEDPNFRGVGNWKFHSRTRFWGAMAIFPISVMADTNFVFPSTLRKPETQTLGGLVIGSFALGCVFWELWPFFPFSVMADTNFVFPSTQKTGDPNFRGVGNWKFCSRTHFWGAMAIFLIFCNG